MKIEDTIANAAADAFFPNPDISASLRKRLLLVLTPYQRPKFVSDCLQLLRQAGHTTVRGTIKDFASEARLNLFFDTVKSLQSNSRYWMSGMDPDVLEGFPAQALVRVLTDVPERIDWPSRWLSEGGRLFEGRMIALKWEPIWSKISEFELPWPPFQLGSGYDVEDVDCDEARSLGFSIPTNLRAKVTIGQDRDALRQRFSAALNKLISTPPVLPP